MAHRWEALQGVLREFLSRKLTEQTVRDLWRSSEAPIPENKELLDYFNTFTRKRAALVKLLIDQGMHVPGVDMEALLEDVSLTKNAVKEEALIPDSPGPAVPDEVAQLAKSHSCLIDVPGVRRGSGYLVNWRSRNWVITNHHIIRTKDDAAKAVVTFDFTSVERQARGQVTRARLDSAQFYTSEKLDCTLVQLTASVDRAGAPLPDPPPAPVKGAIVHLIHHPNGQPRHVSSERIEAVLDDFIRCDSRA